MKITKIQLILVTLLYYGRIMDSTLLVKLIELDKHQTNSKHALQYQFNKKNHHVFFVALFKLWTLSLPANGIKKQNTF